MSAISKQVKVDYSSTNLFQPLKVGNIELKHRVALAPATRNRTKEDASIDTELVKEYYNQRSKREGTLIVSEGTCVNNDHLGTLDSFPGFTFPVLLTESQASKWKQVIGKIHENKSFFFFQIAWVRFSADPSALVESFSQEKIKEVIQDFVDAADRAFEAGADGIELHSSNGSLLYQFLNPGVNNRKDQYGGSIENRSRLHLEIIDAIASKHGYEKISIRFSPFFRHSPEDSVSPYAISQTSYFVAQLEERRSQGKEIAYLSIVEARIEVNEEDERKKFLNESVDFIPSIYNGVLLRSGNFITDEEKAKALLKINNKTILGFGRYFISNPDLPDRLEKGSALNAYNRPTFYSKGAEGYIDYPTQGEN